MFLYINHADKLFKTVSNRIFLQQPTFALVYVYILLVQRLANEVYANFFGL